MVVAIITTLLALFITSQVYWALRLRTLATRFIAGRTARRVLLGVLFAGYALVFAYNFHRSFTPTRLTLSEALLGAPFQWWVLCSILSFLVVLFIGLGRVAVRAASRTRRSSAASDAVTSRRHFLERAAGVTVAAPYVAGAYGLFYGRLNLETTQQQIVLPRLPEAFHGFRIAQLSDIHIGPFMSEDEIRKYVRIANSLKPDLIVLTGDYVTWDPGTQRAVVNALSGLRAPHGVYGCLGNHDSWAKVEASITALFEQAGIHILRQSRASISAGGETVNLIGVDYQRDRGTSPGNEPVGGGHLAGVGNLMMPGATNILLSHNPNTFDRAAAMGIDLSLAGHTHGGQIALEFISPEVTASRLVTPYVAGWFEKPGGQLYVNRGIGTVGVPIRVGAPPELTVFELLPGRASLVDAVAPGAERHCG